MMRHFFWKGYDRKETVSQRAVAWFPDWLTPNALTTIRMLLAVPIIWLIVTGHYGWAAAAFVLAFALDYLDGPLARVKGKISSFGKLYDPFADKVVFLAALLTAGFDQLPRNLIWMILVLEVTLVLMAVSVGFMVRGLKRKRPLGANIFGKLKMSTQVIGTLILFINPSSAAGQSVLELVFWVGVGLAGLSIIGHLTFSPGRDPSQGA